MKTGKTEMKRPVKLRKRTEEFLNKNPKAIKKIQPRSILNLVEDLQITQIELENQNEKLRRVQLELEKARDKYADLYDSAPIGYFTIDEKGIILEANLKGSEMLEIDRRSLIGTPFGDYISEEFHDTFYLYQNQLLETKSSSTCDLKLLKKNGPAFYAHLESMVVQDSESNRSQLRISINDISVQKRAEEALKESEDKLRAIFEDVNDEIAYLDAKGTVIDVNKRVEDIFGYKPEEVIGKQFTEIEFCHPDSLEKLAEQFIKSLSENFKGLTELVAIRKDGTEIHIEASTSAIKKDGEIKNFINIVRDITERKKLEARLQQAYKMEAIGTLAGGIAHEYNNILGIIVGNTESAMNAIPESNPAYCNLEEIHTACLRARDVVKQVLAFGRQSKPELKPVNLNKIVRDCIRLIRASIPSTIKIHKNLSNETAAINGDSTQINQILLNLCNNAAYAMRDESGVLRIGLENVELDESDTAQYHNLKPGSYVRLTISDTGCGIRKEIIDKIFDPYFTTRKAGEGSGMGLAVVYGIVNSHGGEITVQSEPDRGTSFNILFPAIECEIAPESASRDQIQKGRERILFVDDEEGLLFTAKLTLGNLGYEVVTEKNPLRALEIFREQPDAFDIIITDMTMPDMAGDKFAKNIMNIRPDIPVVLCTGHSEHPLENKAKEMGIRAFVMKPFLVRDIAKTIRQILDGKIG